MADGPRDGLSEHWRSPLDPLAVQAADRAVPSPALLAPVERVRAMPLRAKLSIGGALLGTLLVGWLVAMRFADDPKSELRHTPVAPQPAEPQQAQQPAAAAVAQGSDLPRELGVRRRSLFHYHDLYFHLVDFAGPAAEAMPVTQWGTASRSR